MTTIAKERIKGCIHGEYYVEMAFSAEDFLESFRFRKMSMRVFVKKSTLLDAMGCETKR